jgi:YHS domain-containing protein
MSTHNVWRAVTVAAALFPRVAGAQHDAHQSPAPQAAAEAAQCARVQPVVTNIIDAAMGRLETARQSNNPTEMRAAMDHTEAALRDIRTQLAPCSAAAAATVPHAGQATPSTKQPTGTAAPATRPQAPPGAAEPHAGHVATPPKPASARPATAGAGSTSKTKPPAAAPDPHAGHPGAVAKPADPAAKRAAPAAKAAPAPKASAPSDSHGAHGTTGKPRTDVKDGKVMDPVTGLMVDPATAPGTTYQGQTYFFSSEQSRKEFLANPAKFTKKPKE